MFVIIIRKISDKSTFEKKNAADLFAAMRTQSSTKTANFYFIKRSNRIEIGEAVHGGRWHPCQGKAVSARTYKTFMKKANIFFSFHFNLKR